MELGDSGGTYVSTAKFVRVMIDKRTIPVIVANIPTQKTMTTRRAFVENIIIEWTTQMGSAMMAVSTAIPTPACVHIMIASLSLEMHSPLPGGFHRSLQSPKKKVSLHEPGRAGSMSLRKFTYAMCLHSSKRKRKPPSVCKMMTTPVA